MTGVLAGAAFAGIAGAVILALCLSQEMGRSASLARQLTASEKLHAEDRQALAAERAEHRNTTKALDVAEMHNRHLTGRLKATGQENLSLHLRLEQLGADATADRGPSNRHPAAQALGMDAPGVTVSAAGLEALWRMPAAADAPARERLDDR